MQEIIGQQSLHDCSGRKSLHQGFGNRVASGAALPAEAGHDLSHAVLEILERKARYQIDQHPDLIVDDVGIALGREQRSQQRFEIRLDLG